jgi:hypothetical protein
VQASACGNELVGLARVRESASEYEYESCPDSADIMSQFKATRAKGLLAHSHSHSLPRRVWRLAVRSDATAAAAAVFQHCGT